MQFPTKSRRAQILTWLIWAIACLGFLTVPELVAAREEPGESPLALTAVVTAEEHSGVLFPW